jgi:hypothetical protein
MNEEKEVKRSVCGIEGTIDIRGPSMQSVAFSQDEMRRRCKLASKPGFNFDCKMSDVRGFGTGGGLK